MIHWSNKHIKIHSLYKLSQLTEASPAITINNNCESLQWSQIYRLHFVLLTLTTTLCTCSSIQSFLSWLWIYVTSKHWILIWMYFKLLRSIMTLPFCNMARDFVLHWIVPYLCRHDMNCVLNVIHNYQDSYKLHWNKTLSDTTRDKPLKNCQYSLEQDNQVMKPGKGSVFSSPPQTDQNRTNTHEKLLPLLFYFVPVYKI